MSFTTHVAPNDAQILGNDMEILLNAVRISYINQESKVLALQKLVLALQQGKTSSKVQLQESLSQLEEFLDSGTQCDKESFNGILRRMEDSLRKTVPSSILFIMSPSTYRCRDEIAHWIPVTLPEKEWTLFDGLEYKGKKPCWVTASTKIGTSGMVNSGIWLGLTLRSFGCSLDFLDGHWYTLIQRKEVDDFDSWIRYLAGYDCHIEVEW
ncbi:hypothetical protein DL96DRAFT_1686000 [Flagelloscypha sp. PMI_526]|nr:hypothetical protein DL96DRAFT_1686000 [Flagelloscypha sp. PMI_526]